MAESKKTKNSKTKNNNIKEIAVSIKAESEVNESYFLGLLWSNPIEMYGEYDKVITSDILMNDVWKFYYELGKLMYDSGVQVFDKVTIMMKVEENNLTDTFESFGGYKTIKDVIDLVGDYSENASYYYEKIEKAYTMRQMYLLFGEKVFLDIANYKWSELTSDEILSFWTDELNKVGLRKIRNYEAENLYIDADEFIRKLKEDSEEMLPFFKSKSMNIITQGVAKGHVYMFGGFGNTGKALSLDTPIPTPNGWKTMGDLKVGEMVFGKDGKPTKIIAKSKVFTDHDVYEITFDDGEKITADAEHQWSVRTEYSEKCGKKGIKSVGDKNINKDGYFTITTEEMVNDYLSRRKDNKGNIYKYKIPMQQPVEYEEKELLVKPYTLGMWLGDGTSSSSDITVGEQDLENTVENLTNDGYNVSIRKDASKFDSNVYTLILKNPKRDIYCERGHKKEDFWNYENKKCRECDRIRHSNKEELENTNPKYYNSVMQQLREINVLNNKHIPIEYLQSSIEQRYELLRGLMDSDGYVDELGYCEFSQKNKVLVDNVSELLSSLGIKHSVKDKKDIVNGKEFNSYRISFYADKNNSCFKLDRKHNRLKGNVSKRRNQKSIVDIKKVKTVETQCISVDNEEHLYLAGNRMTVTHNSSILAEKFVMSCVENGEKLILILNEEDAQSFRQKILLSILNHYYDKQIDRSRLINGNLTKEDENLIRLAFGKMEELMDGDESQIKVIFMERYVMSDLEKIIRFWANRGYENLAIDTHKVSDDSKHQKRWETFVEDMKTIYRLTRKNSGGCNLRTWVNFQLADSALKSRYLTFDAIGEGKASKNEASVVQMFRPMWSDEYDGGTNELRCFQKKIKHDLTGKPTYTEKEVELDKAKTYYLLFTPKNRFGKNNDNGQEVLVFEPAFHRNAFYEKGWTTVQKDFS